MTDKIIRKTVRPAHVGACIPDPAHAGNDVAQDGTEVVWDHYWIGRLARGEIIVMSDDDIAKIAAEKKAAADKKAEVEKAVDEREQVATVTATAPAAVKPAPLAPAPTK